MPSAPAPFPEPVYVARPLLPPLEEFVRELGDIWSAAWLTNNGAKHVALEQALSGRNGFGIDHQFFNAVTGQKIEHTSARNHVDTGQRAQHGRDAALHFDLRIDDAAIARDHVGVSGQAEKFSHLSAGYVEHGGLNRSHGSLS